MALLYYVNVSSNPDNVSLFPPALTDWYTNTLVSALSKETVLITNNQSTIVLFSNESKLNSFVSSTKLTTEQQAQFDEWKTAHNITVTFSVHELPSSDITVLNPF